MSEPPRRPPANDEFNLSGEWREAAELAARNLGMGETLQSLTPEHWEIVLHNVEARMHIHGVTPPFGWKKALAQQVGRSDG
ncbi:hypothetical protein [Methylobacterium soli]|uniref:Uncharacterized protein n=1 Tax=Methylobacterium soli TaxID=553447 RepID=A0A6L3SYF0_9HYPH|nr:hypothetical protein [Methylobacterium soli]KAB1078238.1 hypothetical protein F6X53_15920 [Methylobacterium soli]GJE45039.1 hypothetical protein AEGHOMDF_4233 [Methylobacterium soli]